MKTTISMLMAMIFCLAGFSQKSELKAADKAMKGGDSATAISTLEGITGMIGGADDKIKGQYYYTLGKAYADQASKGNTAQYSNAVGAFQKALDVEAGSKSQKYTADIQTRMKSMSADLVNAAVEDGNNNKYKEGAEKLYMGYKMSPQDTNYLYFAASYAVNAKDYEIALDYYNQLKDLNYDGSTVEYKATNNETGATDSFGADQFQRDIMVKGKSHSNPTEEKSESKRSEIVKNIALIYTTLGQNDKAIQAYKDARVSSPNDVNLVLNQANLYYSLDDKEKFKELMGEAATMAPDNPDLHYNIGVINMEQGNLEEARASYEKSIEIDPNYMNAYLNLSTSFVNEGNGLIDEMNSLGTSRADAARYEELKAQKDGLFLKGATILENALKLSPDNQGVLSQLKNIYGALGDTDNFKRIKELLGEDG
ncbi:MAG: tetratricopeptide repeat protein [Eudoraea sp.]|nr:tetratricopeptide repeat protein [Eudoraea sp.]